MQKVLFNKTYEEYIGGDADTQLTLGDDTKSGSFHAHVKMSFWQETQLIWEMPSVEGEAVLKGDVCECDTPDCKHEWFQSQCDYYGDGTLESHLKWILTLKAKPASNVYKMKLGGDWDDFEYLYQPPFPSPTPFTRNGEDWLLQKTPWDPTTIEIRRPACMDGGIAVYHKWKRNHEAGGKNYRTGKIGNFHRPKATDEDGNGKSAWCSIAINGNDYEITIPQDFVDNAIYPIRINDTFGLTSKGASDPNHLTGTIRAARGYQAPSTSGTGNSIHVWTRGVSGDTANCGIYPPGSPSTLVANSQTSENSSLTDGGFSSFSFASGNPAITASIDYAIAFQCDGTLELAFDGATGEGQLVATVYASTLPSPLSWDDLTFDRRYSMYVDYTVGVATEIYSRGDILDLPSGVADLETVFGSGSYAAVESDDANRVAQSATGEFTAFTFKDKLIGQENIRVTWNGKTDLAPSSQTIFLQIYNRTTRFWETVDSDSTSAVNADFTLTYDLTANLDDYFDSGNWIAARVYQEAA